MNIRQTCFSDLSRYRSELMGLAMIFVMLFHVWLPKSNPMYGLVRCGNVGVDMFLFLSGIGLWYSWTGNRSVVRFSANVTSAYIRHGSSWHACFIYLII